MDEDREVIDWIEAYFARTGDQKILINALLALQERFGFLPKVGIREVARHLGLSAANAFGVATFYNQFRFVPPGRHAVKVCMGTACHIKQASKILDHWKRKLDLEEGQVSDDREYSLDRVACVGCCTMAPVTVVGEQVIGDMSPTKVDGLLLQHQIAQTEDPEGAAG